MLSVSAEKKLYKLSHKNKEENDVKTRYHMDHDQCVFFKDTTIGGNQHKLTIRPFLQKYALSSLSKTHRSIRVQTTGLTRFRLSTEKKVRKR